MKVRKNDLAVIFFLITPCFNFIFEEILYRDTVNSYVFCAACMAMLLSLSIFFVGKISKNINNLNGVWALYLVAVFLSLFQRSITISLLFDVLIIAITVICVVIFRMKISDLKVGTRLLYFVGIINCGAVLIQFVFKDYFNDAYWNLLSTSWHEYAEKYFDRGYFSGLQSVPGHAAGYIIFAIGLLVSKIVLRRYSKRKKHNLRLYIVLAILFVALLLTGKKGVLFAGAIAIVLMAAILMMEKKQVIKLIALLLGIIVIYNLLKYYSLKYANVPIFYRLNQFFVAMSEGNEGVLTTGRNYLYSYAMEQWSTHKWFGIGWRAFRDYTVTVYNYPSKHDVNLDYLQFLCETGLVGFILIIIPIVITLRKTILLLRKLLKNSAPDDEKKIILYASFIQFYTLIYAFFEIPFYDKMFFGIYAFSCIVIQSAYKAYTKKEIVMRH